MTPPWWRGYAATETWVRCGGADHVVRWARGRLDTPDHADLDDDRVAAVDGPPPVCAQVADAWARHLDDLQVLVLASRGRGDRLVAPPPGARAWAPRGDEVRTAALPEGFGLWAYTVVPSTPAADALDTLLTMGGQLGARLAATVAACWAAWLDEGHPRAAAARPALVAALTGWATCALRDWLGQPHLAVAVEMVPAGTPASVDRDGATVVARLPFDWLVQVGLRDATVLLDRFVVGVTEASENRWTFETVDRTFAGRRAVTVTVR